MVLSGDGGDELFGGYDRYLPHPRVAAFDRLAVPGARAAAALAWPLLPHGTRGKNFLRHVAKDWSGRYLDSIAFFHADERAALYSADVRAAAGLEAERRLARHFDRFAALPNDSRMMRFDFETYLPEDVLTKVDRMSMAHSIESRVPLLDNQVIDFAASLPARFKIKGGRRKHILKDTLKTMLPRGDPVAAQAGLRRAARHLVPRRPDEPLLRHPGHAASAPARLLQRGVRAAAAARASRR